MRISLNQKIETSKIRALREDEDSTFEIASLMGIAYTIYVLHNYRTKEVVGYVVPEGGMIRRKERAVTTLNGFILTYEDENEYPDVMKFALGTAVDDVVRSVSAEYGR